MKSSRQTTLKKTLTFWFRKWIFTPAICKGTQRIKKYLFPPLKGPQRRAKRFWPLNLINSPQFRFHPHSVHFRLFLALRFFPPFFFFHRAMNIEMRQKSSFSMSQIRIWTPFSLFPVDFFSLIPFPRFLALFADEARHRGDFYLTFLYNEIYSKLLWEQVSWK